MRIRIPAPTSWRAEQKLYAFGEYRIPQDMPLELAERAIAEGAAVLVEEAAKPKAVKPRSSTAS